MNQILTAQMVRDHLCFRGPMDTGALMNTLKVHTEIQMDHLKELLASLETRGIIRLNEFEMYESLVRVE